MAFTSAITKRAKMIGTGSINFGTWTTDTTGGDIDTGLLNVDAIFLQTSGSAVSADQSAVNETLPCDGSAVTIVCTSGADGTWMAIGY